jgi:pyruvate ferredoxin oxidoreductase beta subunit
MEQFGVYVPRLTPSKEYFAPGHRACIGCGEVLALRLVCKALGRDVFENTAAVASGIEAGLKVLRRKGKISEKKITVVAIGGDGGTSDIGIQALSGALERGHDFLYVCFDNEAYMNTGIQRSSATPYGAMTTTSPPGKVSIGQKTWKKNMPAIAVAHNIPYVATANPSYPIDLINKVEKATKIEGPKYLHIYSVCPTGWRSAPDLTIRLGRLAVETGIFPLYEVENGKYRLNIELPKLRPVNDYLKTQGRFRHLTDDLRKEIQKRMNQDYARLKKKALRK